jgi:hypothetical protein
MLPLGCRGYAKLPRHELSRDEVRTAVAGRRALLTREPCAACLPRKPCHTCLTTTPRELERKLPLDGRHDTVSLHAHLLLVGWLDADEETWLAAECRLLRARLLPWTAAQYRTVLPARVPWRWVAAIGRRDMPLVVRHGAVVLPTVPPVSLAKASRPEKRANRLAREAAETLRLTVLREALLAKMREALQGKLQQLRQLRTTGRQLGRYGLLGLAQESPLELLRWSGFRPQRCPACGLLAPGRCCQGLLRASAATAVMQKLQQGVAEGWVMWQSGGLLGGTFRLLAERRLRWLRIVQALRPHGFELDGKRRTGSHPKWTLECHPWSEEERAQQRQWRKRMVAAVGQLCPVGVPLVRAAPPTVPALADAQQAMATHGMGDNVLQLQKLRLLCTHNKGQPRSCALKRGVHKSNNGYLFLRGQQLFYRCHAAGCRDREILLSPFFAGTATGTAASCGAGLH